MTEEGELIVVVVDADVISVVVVLNTVRLPPVVAADSTELECILTCACVWAGGGVGGGREMMMMMVMTVMRNKGA